MSELIQAQRDEITFVESSQAICDGPKTGHHPRVFLTLKGGVENEVVCPYCGHAFRSGKAQDFIKATPAKRKKTPAKKASPKKTTAKKVTKKGRSQKKAAPKKRVAKRKAS